MSAASPQILLVEDHEGDARLLQELLAEAGAGRFTLLRAERLETALTHASRPGIDLILLDLSLPDSQGTETLARMHEAAKGIPIVVLTGLDDEELGLRLIQSGAQDYLVKGQVTGPLLTRALRYAVERKRLEEELREKSRLLQSVLHSMADGVVVADETGSFQVWNPAAERIVGAGPADIGIDQWSEHYRLFLPDGVTPFPTEDLPLARAIHGESVTNVPVFLGRPDQTEGTWLSVNARPLRDETGRLKGGVAVFRDVTIAKRTEEALQESEARLRSLVSNLPGAVYRCACDPDWTMEFLSDAIERLCGYPASDFLGNRVRSYTSVIDPQDRELVEREVLDAVAQRRPYTIEYRLLHKDGGIRWVYEKGQGVFGTDGRILYLDGVIFNITER
ncbi:MAG TPA: PAS domain S-box protein, partial [Nitrospiraceae bacterium]|nr:PAS domain S-box protein [Nitrospiraceae bacterium]